MLRRAAKLQSCRGIEGEGEGGGRSIGAHSLCVLASESTEGTRSGREGKRGGRITGGGGEGGGEGTERQ